MDVLPPFQVTRFGRNISVARVSLLALNSEVQLALFNGHPFLPKGKAFPEFVSCPLLMQPKKYTLSKLSERL